MRRLFARSMASVLVVVSLGAAQGPKGSGSKDTQVTVTGQAVQAEKAVSPARPKPHRAVSSWDGFLVRGVFRGSGHRQW